MQLQFNFSVVLEQLSQVVQQPNHLQEVLA